MIENLEKIIEVEDITIIYYNILYLINLQIT